MTSGELLLRCLRDSARERGLARTFADLAIRIASVFRDLTPARRRMRYGDIQFDFDYNVNTTWANVPLRTRLREAIIGAEYQTTDPVIFHEAIQVITNREDLSAYTFVDLGSGKGRVLLLASEYPFARLIGIELLPELHEIAGANLERAAERLQHRCVDLVCGDARDYLFPDCPLVVFLFNPFPSYVFAEIMRRLDRSVAASPRPVYVVFHNILYEDAFKHAPSLHRIAASHQFVIYTNRA